MNLYRPAWFDRRRDSAWQRIGLAPLRVVAWGVATVAWVLRTARRRGWLARERLGCHTVSIGNLAVGGSAKTPLAARVAQFLHEAGWATAILSRGYGRSGSARTALVSGGRRPSDDAARDGDEPVWLGARTTGIPVWVAPRRIDAGHHSIIHFGTQVAVLDDGFQHTRLARDLEIIAIDGRSGFGNGAVLPRGPLRESLSTLRFADALIVVDGPLCAEDEARVSQWAPLAQRFDARRLPRALTRHGEESGALSLDHLRRQPVGMLCGIAQPESFRATLEGLGARVEAERVFPDHHPFRATDLRHLEDDATLWVTTEKDALKIDPAWIRRGSLLVLSIDIAFEDEAAFRDWLLGRIDRLARS